MKKSKLQWILLFIIISIILCIPAFDNGFPFMFPDSMGYVIAGFKNTIGNTRVWLYSGFIRHVSLWESLWLVVFGQGLIVTGTIYLMFKYFFREKYQEISFVLYMLIIAGTTAVSFHISMLMPDIFTPIMVLCFCLLLLARNITKIDYGLTVLLFILASGMHNSHVIVNLIMVILVLLGGLIKSWRLIYEQLGITIRKLVSLVVLVISAYLVTCTIHYSKGGDFEGTKGGGIFLFARLCDFGIAQAYLNENCSELEHDICNYRNSLSLGRFFLWSGGSYLNKTDRWSWSDEKVRFYSELCWDILTTPKYLKRYAICSIEATFMQFFCFNFSPLDGMELSKDNGYMKKIIPYYPTYYIAAQNSRQIQELYNDNEIEITNKVQLFILYLSGLLVLVLLFFDKSYPNEQKAIALIIVFGMLTNAFVTGSISGVYNRYQSRIAWIITLPAYWFVYKKIGNILKEIQTNWLIHKA